MEFPLALELKDAGVRNFENVGELLDWLDLEVKFWSWLGETFKTQIGIQDDKRQTFSKLLHQARNSAATQQQGLLDPKSDQRFLTALNYYVQTGLCSATPRAKYVANARQQAGDLIASIAIADYLGSGWPPSTSIPDGQRYVVVRGRSVMPFFDAGVTNGAGDALRAATSETVTSFNQFVERVAQADDEARKRLDEATQKTLDDHCSSQEKIAQEWQALTEKFRSTFDDARERLVSTETEYKEKMKLRASVQYWTDKSKEHRTQARAQKYWLIGYFVTASFVAAASIYLMFGQIVALAKDMGERASAPLLLIAGSTVLFVSALIWIGRILVRIFFDERLRALDAAERATMAETYSALTHENLVDQSERIVVLTALFRPTVDNQGRDDGAPEALQHTILAKLLDTKAK